ncbi:hypothetical protein KAJ83_03775 [Marivibrio halodurans]|uniref:Hook-length control protein FliK n=1 Tax=Marivibrio halodurans TaxID=2039722 RepID=A0A8J7V2T8_9PROT|nr:hypothetical protein [Marivibrio halodurans]MBP5856114.1 hypothetical protein [Marivibrio halodurans]
MNQPIPPGTTGGAEAAATQPSGRAIGLTPHLIRQFVGGGELTGRVSATGGEGRLQITTPHGTLTLQTSSNLPPGTPVTLQMTSLGPPAQLAITPQVRPGAQAGAAGARTGPAAPSPPLPTLTATISTATQTTSQATGQTTGPTMGQAPASPQGAQGSNTAATPTASGHTQATTAGAAVRTTLTTGTVLQATVTGGAGTTAQANAGGGNTVGTVTPAGLQATFANGQALPAGTGLAVRLVAVSPQGQAGTAPPPPTLNPASGALQFTGTVTGQNAAGQTMVATSAGTLTVATGGAPPPGTQLTLELAGDLRPPLMGAPGSAGSTSATRFAGVEEALRLLAGTTGQAGGGAQASSQQALQMLQNVLPQQNAQMAPAMLFFLSALRSGGLDRLIGADRTNAIDRLQKGLGERIEGDLRGAASGRARDGAGGEWRALSLPMLNDGELERIRLYMRDRRGGEDEAAGDGERGPRATRFILEASFTRLGQMQFDGLVRDKSFDLVVRTHQPFQEDLRDGIRGIFTDQLSAHGWAGSVTYQVVRAFDVVPIDSDTDAENGVTV